MVADPLKELDRLVGQAVAEVVALRRERLALERRVEVLKRDLRARDDSMRRLEGEAEQRSDLVRRVRRLVRRLEELESA